MEEKNIPYVSYADALDGVITALESRTVDLRKKHIVIVPDRCTLTAERLLCERLGGAFDVSVTTWSRMFTSNVRGSAYLPRQGSVMILRRILEDVHGKLKCYSRSYRTRGFAAKLYETISQLAVCGVRPNDVKLTRGGQKAEDIALVYAEYINRTEGMYSDAAGRMRLLCEWLKTSEWLNGATVYIACFDAYTKQMRNIIDIMRDRADDVRIFDAKPTDYRFGDVELYAASSPVFAAKAIVGRIAYEASKGVPYDEMCIVTADQRPDELKRLLGENGVPYCAPVGLKLSEHTLGRFLALALSLPARGYRAADAVKLSKNGFSGVDKADSDAFERYVDAFGITYKLFLSPFTPPVGDASDGARELCERAERARGIIARLAAGLSDGGETFAVRIGNLIDYAEAHYFEPMKSEDEGRANPFEKARGLAALCESLLGGADERIMLESFTEGMSTTDLASRPALSGAVEIGGERDFRARRFSRVYVSDFDSDKHPAITPDSGLLSDDDIEQLRESGTEVTPTTTEVNKRARDEFFMLLSGAEKIMLVYTDKSGSALEYIRNRAMSTAEGGTENDRLALDDAKSAGALMRLCPTRNMLIEQYLSVRAQVKEERGEPPYYRYARELIGSEAEKCEMPPYPTVLSGADGFMLSDTTKVSQLETYFSCPMKHFFRYGLRLKKADTGELQPLDVGSLLHEVAEKYIAVMDDESPSEAAERLLGEALARSAKGNIETNKSAIALLVKEASGMCGAIMSQIKAGSFKPIATEKEFGLSDEGLGGVTLNAGGKTVTLRGKIDRVDTFGKLARVIDYKTGTVKFTLTELRCGVKIQLLVYLAVMIKAGYRPAGAFYFSTLADFGAARPYTLTGVCANEEETLTAMDGKYALGESDVLQVKKKGSKLYVGYGETEKDLTALADYALRVSERAAEEIISGYIAPSPYGGSGADACRACEFGDVCSYDGEKRTPLTATLTKKDK